MKNLYLCFLVLFVISTSVLTGENIGDFRSAQTGNWGDLTTWQTWDGSGWVAATSTPDSLSPAVVAIVSPHNVTVAATVAVRDVTVNNGATVTINASPVTLYITNEGMTVNGVLTLTGNVATAAPFSVAFTSGTLTIGATGIVNYNQTGLATGDKGALPIATWLTGSTLNVNSTGGTGATGWNSGTAQNFYNVNWNCPLQTGSFGWGFINHTIGGTVSILATNAGRVQFFGGSSGTLNILGDFIVSGASNATVNGTSSVTYDTINVYGKVNVNTTGNFSISRGSQGGSGTSIFNFYGDSVKIIAGAMNNSNSAGGKFVFKKNGVQYLTVLPTTLTGNSLPFEVATGALVTLSSPVNVTTLFLNGGKIQSSASNPLLIGFWNSIASTLTSGTISPTALGSSTSFVDGPMAYLYASAAGNFSKPYPIGKGTNYRPLTLSLTQTAATISRYTAEVFNGAPPANTLPGTLNRVSSSCYFDISALAGGSAFTNGTVLLNYYLSDGITDAANLRIAQGPALGGGTWVDLGGVGTGIPAGTITSTTPFTDLTNTIFTFANNAGGGNSFVQQYQSAQSGNWGDLTTWQTWDGTNWIPATSVPDSTSPVLVTVVSPHNVTVAATVAVRNVTVNSGATLTVNGTAVTLYITNEGMTVNGELNLTGTVASAAPFSIALTTGTLTIGSTGVVNYNQTAATTTKGALPIATWQTGSTLNIYSTGGPAATGWNSGTAQNFYNVNWNCPNMTANFGWGFINHTIGGTFTVLNTNVGRMQFFGGASGTLNIMGDFIVSGTANATVNGTSAATNDTLNIYGKVNINTTGNFSVSRGSQAGVGTSILNFYSDSVKIAPHVMQNSNSAGAKFVFKKNGTQYFYLSPDSVAGNALPFQADTGSTVVLISPVNITTLYLNGGKFISTLANPLILGWWNPWLSTLTSGSISTTAPGSSISFVDGPMAYLYATAAGVTSKSYPIGKGDIYRPLTLSLTQTDATLSKYTAEFFNAVPPVNSFPGTLNRVSDVNHFVISQATGGSAFTDGSVLLNYAAGDGVSDTTNLRIAQGPVGGSGTWVDLGGTGHGTPGGTITSSNPFTDLTTNTIFTLANNVGGSNFGPASFQVSVDVNAGWNMVSIPGLHPTNQNVDTWWPFKALNSSVFKFAGSYLAVTVAEPGLGYWMRHSDVRTYNTGDEWPAGGITIVPNNPIPGNAGWNMIGCYNYNVATSGITTSAGTVLGSVFGYSGGYNPVTTLLPGYGYWIRLSLAANIILPNAAFKGAAKVASIDDKWGKIILTDNSGRNYTLYAAEGKVDLTQFDMPPAPPAGMMDVRYESQRYVENITEGFQTIDFNGMEYPVTVRVEGMSIRLQDQSGKVVKTILKAGEKVTISNSEINKLMVSGDVIPVEYSLSQNYPNPFNPSTTIQFSLPEDVQNVRLTIYNILGEKVTELLNTALKAGYYNYKWNASGQSSGMYIYNIVTEKFVSTKKMILMK